MYIDKKDADRKLRVFNENGGFAKQEETKYVPLNNAGRGKGSKTLTDEQRESLAKLANLISPKEAADLMNVSYGTAVNAAKGYVGTNGHTRHKDNELVSAVKEQDDKIEETVLNKVLLSLNVITAEKLEALDPVKAAIVAEKVAGISKRNKGVVGQTAIFAPIIHVPAKKELKDYPEKIIETRPVGL